MIQPLKNSNGFTLLELILSMLLVGFIMAISLGAIRLGISTQEVGQKKTETYQRLRIIGEHLSQKIKSSYPVFVPAQKKFSLPTETLASQAKQLLAFEGKKDSIRFMTFASPIAATDDSVWAHEVRFYLGEHPKSGKTGIIMMEKEISSGNIFTDISSRSNEERYYLLAEDVAYLKFRYYILDTSSPEDTGPKEIPGFQKEPEPKKEAIAYSGAWVDQILFNPLLPTKTEYSAPDEGEVSKRPPAITLPKGVEISIGLEEPSASGNEKKPKLVSSPPVLLLLHSGMEFSLPIKKVNEETNAPS